jgi:hypothetical protein
LYHCFIFVKQTIEDTIGKEKTVISSFTQQFLSLRLTKLVVVARARHVSASRICFFCYTAKTLYLMERLISTIDMTNIAIDIPFRFVDMSIGFRNKYDRNNL